MVDGGKARVILNVLVMLTAAAEVTENLPMLDLLFGRSFGWPLRPRSVTGDKRCSWRPARVFQHAGTLSAMCE